MGDNGRVVDKVSDRYARQLVLKEIGPEGQKKLSVGSALIAGCGALGSTQAHLLVRAGVGRLRVVDSDVPEPSNLPRQLLYDERDVAQARPKAELAAEKLTIVNSKCRIESRVMRISPENVEKLIGDVDVVLDATDNFHTRYVINDACVKHGIPWIYGGILGTSGMTMTVVSDQSACLCCLFPESPGDGDGPGPETVGILNAAPALVGALQATEALKILTGQVSIGGELVMVDLWHRSFRVLPVPKDETCRCCSKKNFVFLHPPLRKK